MSNRLIVHFIYPICPQVFSEFFFDPLNASAALILSSNQLTGFCTRVTLAFNGLSESQKIFLSYFFYIIKNVFKKVIANLGFGKIFYKILDFSSLIVINDNGYYCQLYLF